MCHKHNNGASTCWVGNNFWWKHCFSSLTSLWTLLVSVYGFKFLGIENTYLLFLVYQSCSLYMCEELSIFWKENIYHLCVFVINLENFIGGDSTFGSSSLCYLHCNHCYMDNQMYIQRVNAGSLHLCGCLYTKAWPESRPWISFGVYEI